MATRPESNRLGIKWTTQANPLRPCDTLMCQHKETSACPNPGQTPVESTPRTLQGRRFWRRTSGPIFSSRCCCCYCYQLQVVHGKVFVPDAPSPCVVRSKSQRASTMPAQCWAPVNSELHTKSPKHKQPNLNAASAHQSPWAPEEAAVGAATVGAQAGSRCSCCCC